MSEANLPSQRSHPGNPEAPRVIPGDASVARQGDIAPSQWETVNFPGSVPLGAIPVDANSNPSREGELLNLIRDLNRCNEVLLGRVNQLEESLETAQQALQAEVEHHHSSSNANAPAMAAQQRSMAQLLSELEGSNDALKRQRILAETLQAQLDSGQERVAQLERECTVLQQQHTAKSQSLQKSEETCRDLRSRLQRQQRYTLQFKVALEKCLDMSSPQQSPLPNRTTPLSAPLRPQDSGASPHHPVAMPRADRIQPWTSVEGDPLPDPQLAALLRTTPQMDPPESSVTATASAPESITNPVDAKLWQDLERVVEQAPIIPAPSTASPPEEPTPFEATPTAPQLAFTEPFPWGPTPAKETEPLAPNPPATETIPLAADQPATPAMPEVTTWQPTQGAATIDVQPHVAQPTVPEIPLLKMPITPGTSPSPIVHPLRPQKKKLTSLSAVDLPSFPRLPQDAKTS